MSESEINKSKIRLWLVDGQSLFRESLAHFLGSQAAFDVAKCSDGLEFLDTLKRLDDGQGSPADLILFDLDTSTDPTGDLLAAARAAGYQGGFLVLSSRVDARNLALALKSGASGVFLKSDDLDRLIHAISAVARGEFWIDRRVVQALADQLIDRYPPIGDGQPNKMEERERDVLLGILAGLTNRKIGQGIGLSESAVKNVVQRLFGKAGVKTRSQLVRAAMDGTLTAANGFKSSEPAIRHALAAYAGNEAPNRHVAQCPTDLLVDR
jgi:DNA-binding NarL/FixJ family response regulator